MLPAYGVRDVVVCPGSRNGVLVHNFYTLAATADAPLSVHAVTDERSAAFVALGLILARRAPVALCVTSGSALLGTLPGVAEAAMRRQPLLVISADRPAEWIGQLDGQTLVQPDALLPYAPCCALPCDADAEGRPTPLEDVRPLLDAALRRLCGPQAGPMHINVPLREPLFRFTTPALPVVDQPAAAAVCPEVRPAGEAPAGLDDAIAPLVAAIAEAHLPAIVIGQCDDPTPWADALHAIDADDRLLVLPEVLANVPGAWRTALWERHGGEGRLPLPDVVVHIGGNMVNKHLKLALRRANRLSVWRIEETADGRPDTFSHLHTLLRQPVADVLHALAHCLPPHPGVRQARQTWEAMAEGRARKTSPDRREDLTARLLAWMQTMQPQPAALHVANSTAVRLVAAVHRGGGIPVYANRGLNGIEGSLSVAAGYALAGGGMSVMLIGDLSFFYDQNALWNADLGGNLRILLLNDGGGAIFDRLPGLDASPAKARFIAGGHPYDARHVAETFHLPYRHTTLDEVTDEDLRWLLTVPAQRPVLLEVGC